MNEMNSMRYKVKGEGSIITDSVNEIKHFSILKISASGADIITKHELEINEKIKIKISLPSMLFQVNIKTEGIVNKKIKTENGFEYDIGFIGLSENDINEIDVLVKSAANPD
jgi:hypothetical protein